MLFLQKHDVMSDQLENIIMRYRGLGIENQKE